MTAPDPGRPRPADHQRQHRRGEPERPDRRPDGAAPYGTVRAGSRGTSGGGRPGAPGRPAPPARAGAGPDRRLRAGRGAGRGAGARRAGRRRGLAGPGQDAGHLPPLRPRRSPTSTPRGDAVPTGPRWTRSGRRSSRPSAATPRPWCCAGRRWSAGPTSRRWVRWPCSKPSADEVTEAESLFTEARRRYRGVSPFPVAELDFRRGLMWLGERRPPHGPCLVRRRRAPGAGLRPGAGPPRRGRRGPGRPRQPPSTACAPWRCPATTPSTRPPSPACSRDAGRPQEAEQWRVSAAARYDELVVRHPEAFADHAAEFWLTVGGDRPEGLRLMERHRANRRRPGRTHCSIAPPLPAERCHGAGPPGAAPSARPMARLSCVRPSTAASW